MDFILIKASYIVAMVAIIIILWGLALTTMRFIYYEYLRIRYRKHMHIYREILRHTFGTYLLLGLEFLIAADVIRTIVEFSFKDLGILGGIVVIRTIISFFLDREVGETREFRELVEK